MIIHILICPAYSVNFNILHIYILKIPAESVRVQDVCGYPFTSWTLNDSCKRCLRPDSISRTTAREFPLLLLFLLP